MQSWAQGQGVQASGSLFTSYFRSQYESQLKAGNGQALFSLTNGNRPDCACTFYQNVRFEESELVGEPIVTAILSVKMHFYQLANQSYQPLQFEVRGAGGGTAMALESLAEALPMKLNQLNIPITACR